MPSALKNRDSRAFAKLNGNKNEGFDQWFANSITRHGNGNGIAGAGYNDFQARLQHLKALRLVKEKALPEIDTDLDHAARESARTSLRFSRHATAC